MEIPFMSGGHLKPSTTHLVIQRVIKNRVKYVKAMTLCMNLGLES
jgi:hypothetical protein